MVNHAVRKLVIGNHNKAEANTPTCYDFFIIAVMRKMRKQTSRLLPAVEAEYSKMYLFLNLKYISHH